MKEQGSSPVSAKDRIVGAYLEAAFPELCVVSSFDFETECSRYRLDDRDGKRVHLCRIARNLLDDHRESEIEGLLDRRRLVDQIKLNAGRPVKILP